jgi:hypothetical protein
MAEPLFTIDELHQEPSAGAPLMAHGELGKTFTVMGRKVDVLASLPKLERNTQLHFCTEGKWSSHELLAKLLEITGPADVELTSYSFTEDPVRMLTQYLDSGIIKNLMVLVDKRVKVQNPSAYQLAVANFRYMKLVQIHAKVMIIRNDKYSITVISSANYTRNKRIEVGCITENFEIAMFHQNWIAKHFKDDMD